MPEVSVQVLPPLERLQLSLLLLLSALLGHASRDPAKKSRDASRDSSGETTRDASELGAEQIQAAPQDYSKMAGNKTPDASSFAPSQAVISCLRHTSLGRETAKWKELVASIKAVPKWVFGGLPLELSAGFRGSGA